MTGSRSFARVEPAALKWHLEFVAFEVESDN
jgi:hypothetical protein